MNYSDLPENPVPGVVLQCFCGEFSAYRGDYWNCLAKAMSPCPECGEPLRLVQRRVRYVRISPKKSEAASV